MNFTQKRLLINDLSNEALYNLYAPAVYGHILRIGIKPHDAEKILLEVFRYAFQNRQVLNESPLAPLTNLLNHSHKISNKFLSGSADLLEHA